MACIAINVINVDELLLQVNDCQEEEEDDEDAIEKQQKTTDFYQLLF